MTCAGKQAVHGLSPCLTESAGTGTIVAEDLLLNSKGTILVDDESSTFPLSNCKVSPLKSLTTDMSSAKNTSLNQSSKNLVENDSDVDSPCWKGTRAFCQTPIENSGSLQINNVEKATEKHNSLNPLAPQFFPRISYVKDDFGSSNSCSPVATNFFSGEHMLMKTVTAESPVELNMGIELQPSSNTCGKEKTFNMINDPKNSYVDPVLNLHCKVTQSSSKEDCSMSKGKLEAVVDAENFAKGTKDPRVCRSISDAFTTKSYCPISTPASSSSSGVAVVTDLMKTFEGVSKSLIKSPKPDVGMVVSAMHVLSELLVQASMDGVGSNNEHGHDEIMIQQIINNLNDFSTKRCAQRVPNLESTPADNPLELPQVCMNLFPSYFGVQQPNWATCCIVLCSIFIAIETDVYMFTFKGLEMTSIEALNDPNKLHPENDHFKKKTVFKMFGQSGKSFFAPSSDKGNEIAQVLAMIITKIQSDCMFFKI